MLTKLQIALWPVALMLAARVTDPAGVMGQESRATPAVPSSTANLGGLAVSPGALLRITVADRRDITNTYRVDAAGTILLPEVGNVSVNGLSLREISSQVAARLPTRSGKPAIVRVEFDRSLQGVFVAGQVRTPGLVTMKGPLSLMKVLARAGSPTTAASDVLIVIHDELAAGPGDAPARETRTRIDIKDLRAGRDVLIHDGDTVFVPKAQVFYVLGEVRRPGLYVLDPGMTMTQAVALAGGLTARGSERSIKVIRSVKGEVVELDADPSQVVEPDDTLRIRARLF